MSYQSKQEILKKLPEYQFTSLKIYPNKQLLSKSVILKLNNDSKYFDERALLFIDICYLLIKAQTQNSDFYISTNVFSNIYGKVFMMYSWEHKYKQKMKLVQYGKLAQQIKFFFCLLFKYENCAEVFKKSESMFKKEQNSTFVDLERQQIWRNFIHWLQDDSQKQQQYYYHSNSQIQLQDSSIPSNSYALLQSLQKLLIFQQYSFYVKFQMSLLILPFLEVHQTINSYRIFLQSSFNFCKLFTDNYEHQTAIYKKNRFHQFKGKLFKTFSELQTINYIRIQLQRTKKKQIIHNELLQIQFETNLRKYCETSKTSNQQSSGSILSCDTESMRLKNINICKNCIEFNLKVKLDAKSFLVELKAVFKWVIDDYYFLEIDKIWNKFTSSWHSFIFQSDQFYLQKSHPYKFQLLHESKNVLIKTQFVVNLECSLIKMILLQLDRIIVHFLIFQGIFKNMARFSKENIAEGYNEFITKISSPSYLQDMIQQLRYASLKYEHYFDRLQNLHK